MVRIPGITAVIVFALGCTGAEQPEPTLADMVAGSAQADGSGFVAMENGADVELIPGAQGGFHVWLNMSVQGASGTFLFERRARRLSDNALVFRGLRQVVEIPDQAMDTWWDNPTATPAFMCPSPIGIKVYDEELLFQVELTDEDGEILATDELILVPRCPLAGDLAEFCQEICAG